MADNKTELLPRFASLDELVEFFDNRDLGDYLEQMPEVKFEVEIERKIHLIALDADLTDKLTEIAQSRHISSEELVNSWVREKIQEQAALGL